jgi:hypothetical protein
MDSDEYWKHWNRMKCHGDGLGWDFVVEKTMVKCNVSFWRRAFFDDVFLIIVGIEAWIKLGKHVVQWKT